MHITPSIKEFTNLTKHYSHIPFEYEFSGDFDTPVTLYLKIRGESQYSFLLESALQSGSSGRYSFIGFDPKMVIKCKSSQIEIFEDGQSTKEYEQPIEVLRSIVTRYSVPKFKNMPPFTGGLVGYFSYDSVRLFESIPDQNPDELNFEDFVLLLVDKLIVYDHFYHTIKIIAIVECEENYQSMYDEAREKIKNIANLLKKNIQLQYTDFEVNSRKKLKISSNMTQECFQRNVEIAKEYIAEGDIFQIVLSQRFSIPIINDGFHVYRCLRNMNPSPYMFYFSFNDTVIAGSSPEVLVKCIDGLVTTRPLAGTRRRGYTQYEDRKTAEELLQDEKERSEHVMLVDLGRNDLGRFCKFGSIQIPEFMGIERYSHVMHIVSEVTGKLESDRDSFDVLRGAFPAGTVSGAPKIRAMEIIDELEPSRRGVYAGAVGYIDFHNNIDTCIAIRTLLIKNNTVYIQAGAGIVADSVPEKEYFETVYKAHALIRAVALAEGKSYDFGD